MICVSINSSFHLHSDTVSDFSTSSCPDKFQILPNYIQDRSVNAVLLLPDPQNLRRSLRSHQQLMDQMRRLDYGDVCSLSNNERRCSIVTGVLIILNVDQRRFQLRQSPLERLPSNT